MTFEDKRPATFFLSIDVARQFENAPVVARIHEILRRHEIRAMWSFEFEAHQNGIEYIAASASDYGVLASEAWAHPTGDRTRFARELLARINRASELDIKPIALAVPMNHAPSHYDLMVKHQLAIIRTRTDKISGLAQSLQPRLARYGIWEAEPTFVLPVTSRWTLPWTARRLLQRAIDGHQMVHVAANVAAMSQNATASLSSLEYVLTLASARREAGSLQMVSARELLEIYSPRRERVLSRSVLRAA